MQRSAEGVCGDVPRRRGWRSSPAADGAADCGDVPCVRRSRVGWPAGEEMRCDEVGRGGQSPRMRCGDMPRGRRRLRDVPCGRRRG